MAVAEVVFIGLGTSFLCEQVCTSASALFNLLHSFQLVLYIVI